MSAGLERSDATASIDALEQEGRFLEAIDALTSANRVHRDPEIERRLVRVRHEAFDELVRSASPPSSLSYAAGELPRSNGIPTVPSEELTPEALRAGISSGGCLLVPGLIPQSRIDRLVEDIDRAIEGYDAHAAGAPASDTTPWFEPFRPAQRYGKGGMVGAKRRSVRSGGGAWTIDSPRALYDLLETFDSVNLTPVITGFLGERPRCP